LVPDEAKATYWAPAVRLGVSVVFEASAAVVKELAAWLTSEV
jgi:hypothetical protein